MGRRLPLHSWGWRGQIADLSRMPQIVRSALPWLRVDGRIYAVGGSMGGHETLLLGQYPKLLDGAVAFDSVTNFYLRYHDFAQPRRPRCKAFARIEVGGTPRTNPRGYVLRSPTHWLPAIAQSGVPLQLWWSEADKIVIDQAKQSGAFYRELRKRRPRGRVEAVTGSWSHSFESYEDPASGRRAVARPSCGKGWDDRGGVFPGTGAHETGAARSGRSPPQELAAVRLELELPGAPTRAGPATTWLRRATTTCCRVSVRWMRRC